MVKYAWIFGRVALLVEYFEQIGPDEIEGGARVEVRRVERSSYRGRRRPCRASACCR